MKTLGKVIGIVGGAMFLGFCGLVVCGYLLLRGLGPHYEKTNGKAFWVTALNHDLRQTRNEIEEADLKTFRVFSLKDSEWAKDKNHVYFKGRVLRSADPDEFEITDRTNHLGRSGDNEYKGSRKTRNEAEQFVNLGIYSTDINGAYWFDRLIPGANPETFKLLEIPETKYKNDGAWAADANAVYCNARRLDGSDPTTFRLLGYNYGIDKHRVYYESHPLSQADRKTFVVTYHETKYVIGYDGNFIWNFETRIEATEEQKKLVRAEQEARM